MAKREQFEFTDDEHARLVSLKDRTEATSNAEVVRRALRMFDHMVEKAAKGDGLAITNDVLRLMVGGVVE